MKNDCVFCDIVAGEELCHKIWEDEKHLAFLSLNPNTEGFSVVATKEHYPSYAFDAPDEVLIGLTLASREVGLLLDAAFEDVGRTGLIFEGFGINHLHTKLFPLHGTAGEWQPRKSTVTTFFDEYQGYIASNGSHRVPDAVLAELARKIRG